MSIFATDYRRHLGYPHFCFTPTYLLKIVSFSEVAFDITSILNPAGGLDGFPCGLPLLFTQAAPAVSPQLQSSSQHP